MKFILATITTLMLFSFGFGQTSATTDTEKIRAEIRELFKDAETDFASVQGEVQNRGGGIITYQTKRNYFQSAGFTSWFRYYEAEKTIGLQFRGSGESAKRVFELLKSTFNSFMSNADYRSTGNSAEVFVNNQKIALLQENSDNYLMWFYSNRGAWQDFEALEIDPPSDFFKSFIEFSNPLTNANKDAKTNYEDFVKQCNEFFEKEEFPKAIEACSEAIKLNSSDPALYNIRGLAYFYTPDKPKTGLDALTSIGSANKNAAIADLTKCTELSPTKPECFYALGYVQRRTLQTDKLDKAAKSFSEAIRLKTTEEDIYFQRAEAYREFYSRDEFFGNKDAQIRQRWELAVTDYTKDIELRPDAIESRMGRGLVYLDLEKYGLSVTDFTKALALLNASGDKNPDYLQGILENRARAYKSLGKNQEACEDLKAIGKECS